MVAAVSLCGEDNVQGMVVGANHSLEILPLNNRLKRMLNMWQDVSHSDLNDNLSTYDLRVLLTIKFNTFDIDLSF